MKALVLGAGMMGRAVAYDLAGSPGVDEVALADISLKVAKEAACWTGSEKVRPVRADVARAGEPLCPGGLQFLQHRLERFEISVNVAQHADLRHDGLPVAQMTSRLRKSATPAATPAKAYASA